MKLSSRINDRSIQQRHESKEKGEPAQRGVKSDSTNFKATLPVLSIRNKQSNVMTVSKRMAFIPVRRCRAVYFLVGT